MWYYIIFNGHSTCLIATIVYLKDDSVVQTKIGGIVSTLKKGKDRLLDS